MSRFSHRFALAIVLAALSCHSFAQFGGGMGAGGMGGGGRRGQSGSAGQAHANDANIGSPQTTASKLRDQLLDLRLRLMITREQTPWWDAFYDKAWDFASRNFLKAAPADVDLNAAQAIEQRAAEARDKSARLQAVSEATAKLYDALTPEQRHIADQDLPGVLPP
jgi:LTXXQ motif family protein